MDRPSMCSSDTGGHGQAHTWPTFMARGIDLNETLEDSLKKLWGQSGPVVFNCQVDAAVLLALGGENCLGGVGRVRRDVVAQDGEHSGQSLEITKALSELAFDIDLQLSGR